MRGIGISFSRLFSPKAIIAGAAILAGTAAPGLHADAQEKAASENRLNDQRAYAVPRADPESGNGFAFPQPLNPSDAVLVRQIFSLQARGDIAAAAQATSRLSNRILLGAILAERYTGPHTRPGTPELIQWLKLYGDQPQARAVHAVLVLHLRGPRRGATGTIPKLAAVPYLAPPEPNQSADLDVRAADHGVTRQAGLDARVLALSQAGRLDAAVAEIAAARIDPLYGATLRAEVARTAFALGKNSYASRLAHVAMQECHGALGLPGFVAGLAAWRKGDPSATALFAAAAAAPHASQDLAATAAFWAARSALRGGQDKDYLPWMRRAARTGTGFYAVLAQRMLGQDGPAPSFGNQTLGLADLEAVASDPRGERAFALLQVGQTHLAEEELRYLYPAIAHDAAMRRAVMLVAWQAGMATLASQIAALDPSRPAGSTIVIPPMSLVMPRAPHVDPSLLYALVRVESNFDPHAVSNEGAQGLLQLKPATAAFMDETRGAREPGRLSDPRYNLEMGQRYINYLSGQSSIDGDLLRILASYNAGPTEAAGWSNAQVAEHDPLLYIEMIPNVQTRRFVFCVLRYSWAYAQQLDLPIPSLDALAEGQFPHLGGPIGMAKTAIASSTTIH
jgi:soluble lytic murein transglycosylase-like protein